MVFECGNEITSVLEKKYFFLLKVTIFFLFISVFFCHLDETVTAEGQIRPQLSEIIVKNQFTGIVSEINYNNTQYVNKDDILIVQDCEYEKEYLKNVKNLKVYL